MIHSINPNLILYIMYVFKATLTAYNEESEKVERELLFTDKSALFTTMDKQWDIKEIHENSRYFVILSFESKENNTEFTNGYLHAVKTKVID